MSQERYADLALPPQVETPAAVVDLGRLEANIARMADRAASVGVALRPHAKTHKSVDVAALQLEAGAVGLTVATLQEAEAFVEGGCRDLFVAYPLWAGGGRAHRLRTLHERVRLRAGVDNIAGAETLATAVRGTRSPLEVLIEIDSGGNRTGVRIADVGSFAVECLRSGLSVVGAFTHPGHAYAGRSKVVAAATDEQNALRCAGEVLQPLLEAPPILSGGSTPTANADVQVVATEMRPGTYVFGDRQQMTLSALSLDDVALVVASRVVSTPRPGTAVLDAGSKALSSDGPSWLPGFGLMPAAPEACISSLSEEHAVVTGLATDIRVGDLVSVVPNHVCTAVNLCSELVVCRDGRFVDAWPVGSPSARRQSVPAN